MGLLRSCCGCYDLRQGSFIIGVLSLLFIGLTQAIVAIYYLFNIDELKDKIKFEYAFFFDPESDASGYVFFAILLLVAIIYIIVCILLIHGVRQKRRFMLMPWVFFTFMNMIMAISGGILSMINSHGLPVPILVGVISLFIAAIWIYFTCVVFSFFQALQDGDYW